MRKKTMFYTITAAMTLLLSFAVGEIMIRIAARLSPDVALYLHNDDINLKFDQLQSLLDSQPHLRPHRNWQGYWTNSLGFYDVEVSKKRPGTFRILALGDSFVYGMVPYPASVMTIIERRLQSSCEGMEMEVTNLGIPASGPWQYRQLLELGSDQFDGDAVVVHFYLGNDGAFWHRNQAAQFIRKSVLVTWLYNRWRARGVVASKSSQASREGASGGQPANEDQVFDASSWAPRKQVADEQFMQVMESELYRFYLKDPVQWEDDWNDVFATLHHMLLRAASEDMPMSIVLYPSRLQFDPALVDQVLASSNGRLQREFVDFNAPGQMMMAFCRANYIECLDLRPGFADPGDSNQWYLPNDTHWNLAGNRIAAELEAPWLEQLYCR